MALGTVALVWLAAPGPDPASSFRYALDLACQNKARLRAIFAVPPLAMPALGYSGYAAATQMLMYVEQENVARRQDAEAKALALQAEGEKLGLDVSVDILSAAYDPATPHLLRLAGVSDLCVMSAPLASEPAQHDLLVDMLFGAGAPLLLVPEDWRGNSSVRLAIVAWDGSRAAARAVHDALPLLCAAEAVEIVCVQGEKDLGESAAVELQRHLARHCKAVSVAILPHSGGGVAAALREHARRRDAHLLVMGAYGHSRLREFVLGGATREMLTHIATPTLMSH